MTRALSHEQARRFYDRFGARQDRQGWYEEPAVDLLVAHAELERAHRVIELGCGTGKLAARLLTQHLTAEATYLGLDLSATMVDLARARTLPFGERAEVRWTAGEPEIDALDASCDRFFACYVLDLLSERDIRTTLEEAARLLVDGGLLCVAGLTPGRNPLSGSVSRLWAGIHRLAPALVGGCRPIEVTRFLDARSWRAPFRAVVSPWSLSSEVVVAERAARRSAPT